MQLVNGPLLKHPLNWLTVWLMLLLAGIAGHFIVKFAEVECPHESENE